MSPVNDLQPHSVVNNVAPHCHQHDSTSKHRLERNAASCALRGSYNLHRCTDHGLSHNHPMPQSHLLITNEIIYSYGTLFESYFHHAISCDIMVKLNRVVSLVKLQQLIHKKRGKLDFLKVTLSKKSRYDEQMKNVMQSFRLTQYKRSDVRSSRTKDSIEKCNSEEEVVLSNKSHSNS